MPSELITNIAELTTMDDEDRQLHDAAVVVEDGLIAWIGAAAEAPDADRRTDVAGRAALPGWVDSHSHLVFAGDRSAEFEARMSGAPYQAGGIQTTVTATRAASDDELRANLRRHISEAQHQGTTWLETKTGYGLDVDSELRSARIAEAELDDVTFLGAHLVPQGADADEYTRLVAGPMLDAVAPHVNWIDVFCERGAFDAEQSAHVLEAGLRHGLGLRVHGNQLGEGPGVALAVEYSAASVDHCNYLSAEDIRLLAESRSASDGGASAGTVATLLPACDLSTRQPFGPARELLDAGVTVALAANCNPGSSYTTSMPFVVATAVLQMRMTIREALWAATRGGAKALRRDRGTADSPAIGSLQPGARADIQVLDAPSAAHLAYRPGVPLTWDVWRGGHRIVGPAPVLR
ncbi:imidazolonepropionase [Saxibacter everestensis]|uniref:Imidazolonepropionase n=1 Tax=Saxibacter everestensis TaxID=2909229 RepID=A0ABY8QW73_9MICO|nr:imidazolonepropionase [Brevibacteriaceae bacterium ZFBP1038]